MAESTPSEARPADRSMTVDVGGGVKLHVGAWEPESGAGAPAFLLLHGLASTSESWGEVAGRLAAAGRSAYAVDFRGHGRSDRPDDGYDLATFASDLAAVTSELGPAAPVLVGHSLGANVILQALSAGPQMARGVVLVEGGLVDARDQFATLEECLAGVAVAPVAGMPLPRLEGYLRATHPDWSEARLAATISAFDTHADGTVSWRLSGPRFDTLVRALWADRAADRWPAIRVPAVVVAADNGDVVWTEAKRVSETEIRKVIPAVRVEWFESDHDVHSARPAEVASLLLEAFPAD